MIRSTMLSTKTLMLRTLKLLVIAYVLICITLYFFQEKLIFFPEKLSPDHRFDFAQPFEELAIKTKHSTLNALLFRSNPSKGLIFYLHGNAGSLNNWGSVAKYYTDLGYDVFMPDYPGYGKSTGSIRSTEQLFEDLQVTYEEMKKKYEERRIVVLGYSIGTGPAAWLASNNRPRQLILQAPYYHLKDLMRHSYPFLPAFILRYRFRTNEYLSSCKAPVALFHGDQDEVIYYGSSLKLQKEFKSGDTLITLPGQGHNGMHDHPAYAAALEAVLN